jgi:hypothetical protein
MLQSKLPGDDIFFDMRNRDSLSSETPPPPSRRHENHRVNLDPVAADKLPPFSVISPFLRTGSKLVVTDVSQIVVTWLPMLPVLTFFFLSSFHFFFFDEDFSILARNVSWLKKKRRH